MIYITFIKWNKFPIIENNLPIMSKIYLYHHNKNNAIIKTSINIISTMSTASNKTKKNSKTSKIIIASIVSIISIVNIVNIVKMKNSNK